MTIDLRAIADGDGSSYARSTPASAIAPFLADITEYLATDQYRELVRRTRINRAYSADAFGTGYYPATMRGFAQWLRDAGRGPWASTTEPEAVPPGDTAWADALADQPFSAGYARADTLVSRTIRTHPLEPYREDLAAFARVVDDGLINRSEYRLPSVGFTLDSLLNNTGDTARVICTAFRWMRDNALGPWRPAYHLTDVTVSPTTEPLSEGAPPMTNEISTFTTAIVNLAARNDYRTPIVVYHEDTSPDVQTAFHALPEDVRTTWRDLYNAAGSHVAGGEVNLANVRDFDRGRVGTSAYGYSTSSFFAWAASRGVTVNPDGSPSIPADLARRLDLTTPAVTPPALPVYAIGATDAEISAGLEANPAYLATISPVFVHLCADRHWGREWRDYMLGGPNEHSWGARASYVAQFEFASCFAQEPYASEIAALLSAGEPASAPVEAGTPVFDPDITVAEVRTRFARGEHVFAPVADLFREWNRATVNATTWVDYILTGDNTGTWSPRDSEVWDSYWRSDSPTVRQGGFLGWLSRPENRSRIPGAVPPGDSAPAEAAPAAVIPIGPEHPGWQEFAERMAAAASSNGMCPEYDRIAALMQLPTRKDRVTTRITLDIPIDVARGHNPDNRALKEAAIALLNSTGVTSGNKAELRREQTVA